MASRVTNAAVSSEPVTPQALLSDLELWVNGPKTVHKSDNLGLIHAPLHITRQSSGGVGGDARADQYLLGC